MDADGAEGRRQLQGNLPIKSGKVVVAAEIRSTSLLFFWYTRERGAGAWEREREREEAILFCFRWREKYIPSGSKEQCVQCRFFPHRSFAYYFFPIDVFARDRWLNWCRKEMESRIYSLLTLHQIEPRMHGIFETFSGPSKTFPTQEGRK